jgi:hypothetical protein
VEPEVTIVAEQPGAPLPLGIDTSKIPPGVSIQRMRGPPPLKRGGFQHVRGGLQRNLLPQQRPPAQPFPNSMRLAQFQPARRGQMTRMPLKRPMSRGGFMGVLPPPPIKQPRLTLQPLPPMLPPANSRAHKTTQVCRLCGQLSSFCSPLKDKPEMIDFVRAYLDFDIDLEDDRRNLLPESVCRKCTTILSTFTEYKRLFDTAQKNFAHMKESQKSTLKISSVVGNGESPSDAGDDSILPGKFFTSVIDRVHHLIGI